MNGATGSIHSLLLSAAVYEVRGRLLGRVEVHAMGHELLSHRKHGRRLLVVHWIRRHLHCVHQVN